MNAFPVLSGLLPGFADPVSGAQATFRAVLDAMARPGTVVAVSPTPDAPAPLSPVTAALALTLLDMDTPVWLDPAAAQPAVVEYLRFHCGCPLVEAPAAAAFAVVADGAALPPLAAFDHGSDDYPDRGATVIVQVASLSTAGPWRLKGPGIDGTARLGAAPLPVAFPAWAVANHAGFPRGIDVILAAPDGVACLPRSTRLEV